jgi:hypothetical protein
VFAFTSCYSDLAADLDAAFRLRRASKRLGTAFVVGGAFAVQPPE